MIKNLAFVFFFSSLLTFKSQTKNHHITGIDIGYATWPTIIGYKGEVNFNYFYAYKHFCAKLELGASPATNFGNLTKVFITSGYTTNLNKIISGHLMLGIGGIPGNKTYDQNGFNYDKVTNGVLISIGAYYQPLKDNKLFLGINFTSTKYTIYPTATLPIAVFDAHTTEGTVIFTNLSINYKLNGKKQTKPENKS